MPFLVSLLLFATPFALIGSVLGYLTRAGRAPDVAFLVGGLFLIAFGIVAMASLGVIIYPIGVLLFWMGMGRGFGRARARR